MPNNPKDNDPTGSSAGDIAKAFQHFQDGETLLAYDLVQQGLASSPLNQDLHHLHARVLLKLHAPEDALQALSAPELGNQFSGEAEGLVGRSHKDLWLKDRTQGHHLDSALLHYQRAFALGDRVWSGINLATLLELAGHHLEAIVQAKLLLGDLAHSTGLEPFWRDASRAAALVILGREQEAKAALASALSIPGVDREQHLSSLRNLRLLGERCPVADLLPCFPQVCILRFGLHGNNSTRQQTPSAMPNIHALGAVAVLSDTWSLRTAQQVLAEGLPLHLVVPYETKHLERYWEQKGMDLMEIKEVLQKARELHVLSQWPGFDCLVSMQHADAVADGLAHILARQVEGRVSCLPGPSSMGGNEAIGEETPMRAMLAMVFLDLEKSARLTEAQTLQFRTRVLGALANAIKDGCYTPFQVESTGDGAVLVFDKVGDAARFAIQASEIIQRSDWTAFGLPPDLLTRTSIHAGPVFVIRDPLTGLLQAAGHSMVTASRIEPVTPPGKVYASLPAACLLSNEIEIGPYVGRIVLPKGAGCLPAFLIEHLDQPSQFD